MSADQKFMVSEQEVLALIAGPHAYHHKMDDKASAMADSFNQCRNLTEMNVRTHFATLRAVHLSAQAKVRVTDEDVEVDADSTCLYCGAPTRKEVLMRGGDNGWGNDASRTVYRYVPPNEHANVPEDWIKRNQILASECNPLSKVICVSSLRRMLTCARLSQGAPDPIRDMVRNQKTPSAEDRALIANNMEFLVSQSAQGEIFYAFRRKGLDDYSTCTKERFDELSNKPNLFETRIFYTHPAERAAVPDDVRRAVLSKDLYAVLMDVQNGIDSPALPAMANRAIIQIDKARESLTAAPQPPEGARVDGPTAQAFGEWCNTLTHAHTYINERLPENAKHGIELVLDDLREWQRKLAATTLAGKEGAE